MCYSNTQPSVFNNMINLERETPQQLKSSAQQLTVYVSVCVSQHFNTDLHPFRRTTWTHTTT